MVSPARASNFPNAGIQPAGVLAEIELFERLDAARLDDATDAGVGLVDNVPENTAAAGPRELAAGIERDVRQAVR